MQAVGRIGGIAISSIDMDTLGSETVGDYALTLQLCKAFFGDNAERCQAAVAPTPPPNRPPGTDPSTWCVGEEGGCTEPNGCTYCVNSSNFVICPNNITEPCAPGTECKQNSTHAIICDWPEGHYDHTAWKAPAPAPVSKADAPIAEKRVRREAEHAAPAKLTRSTSWFSAMFSW